MNKLQEVINQKFSKLGDTEVGANWCLSALHPSSGPHELRGIPDADAFPSCCMDYETVVSIPCPSGATGTWKCVMNLLAHPVQPVSFLTSASSGQTGYGGIVNPTLVTGLNDPYTDMTVAFARLCNSYRMLYCGVTVDLDASALFDAGSIVAAQMPLEYQMFNGAVAHVSGDTTYAHILYANYTANFPDQAISQMPGAYMGLAKDGVYMPLKFDPLAPWVTSVNGNMVAVANPAVAVSPSNASMRGFKTPIVTPTAGTTFPFYGSAFYGSVNGPFIGAWTYTTDLTLNGDIAVPFQQTNMGHIVAYNMNTAASLTVKVRWGVEMRVEPTSILAPALRPSAMHDSLALMAYSDLAGSLPWAYPSEYNSSGKLLDVIKRAWNNIRPTLATGLGFIPHPVAQGASALLRTLPDFERPSGTGTSVTKMRSPNISNGGQKKIRVKPKRAQPARVGKTRRTT